MNWDERLERELTGLKLIHTVRMEREVPEGGRHTGLASVVQLMGIKL